MTRMLALALILSPPAALAGGTQSEESVLVTYDVRAVMPRWDSGTSWSQSLVLPPLASPRQPLETIENSLGYAEHAAFELHEILTQILGDELRIQGREMMLEGHALTVLAPSGLQEQVRAILAALEDTLGATTAVRVDVLDLAEGGGELVPAGPMADEEAQKLVTSLVARGAAHKSYELELSAGRTARLEAYRRVPFLYDYDVEIAQTMVVFDPIMSETQEGAHLILRGLAVPGGLSLSALMIRSELLGPLRSRPMTVKGLVNHAEGGPTELVQGPEGIQSPEVLVRAFAFDTFLADGKALALTMESALGSAARRELVILRRTGGATSSYLSRTIPRTNRTLIALNAELFRAARLRSDATSWSDDHGILQPNLVASFDGELSGFLLEWLKVRFSVWRRFGPWILVVTDPAWDRDAGAQLERLVKSIPPPAALRTVAIDLRAQGRDPALPLRLRVPLLEGSSAGFLVARGTTAVSDYDSEIAQGAAVPDPYVSAVFDGLALALTLEGSTLEASGTAQLFDGDIGTLELGYALLGPIERPEPRVLRFDERFQLSEGRLWPVRIGGGSEQAGQPGLALEISAPSAAR